MFLWLIFIFFILGMLLGLSLLIWPKYFVHQTLTWNTWFLNSIGYEVQITPKKSAELTMRILGGGFVFIFFILFSMGFDIFLMLFK